MIWIILGSIPILIFLVGVAVVNEAVRDIFLIILVGLILVASVSSVIHGIGQLGG